MLEVAPSSTVDGVVDFHRGVSSTAVMPREMVPAELVSWLVPSVAT